MLLEESALRKAFSGRSARSVATEPWLEELDLNPVPVDGKKTVTVDCLMVFKEQAPQTQPSAQAGGEE